MKAIGWGLATAIFIGFGLEPTAWFFYEISHLLSIGWLYWGYSVFRGLAFVLELYGYQLIAPLAGGLVVACIVSMLSRRSVTETNA